MSNHPSQAAVEAQTWSVRMADSIMTQYPILSEKWDYDWGVTLGGIEQVWLATGERKYFEYIKHNIDRFVQADGSVRKYSLAEYSLDRIKTGTLFFRLYDETGDERYVKALRLFRQQLDTHPRTRDGGFWHKLIYPHQMWLDGVYMASPFYAEYARRFGEPAAFDDVAQQITLMEAYARDPRTGLLYHGWDESKGQRWADPVTGCSPHFWGRAMGWYAMAIVDVLDDFPADHARRPDIVAVFERMTAALAAVADPATGLWYQVLDQGPRPGNYLEASGSCMFTYALAKAARLGIGGAAALGMAERAYEGILAKLIRTDAQGLVHLEGNCLVAGLGGEPYRDGSYEYYVSQPIVTDDFKGVGPFIRAGLEIGSLTARSRARADRAPGPPN